MIAPILALPLCVALHGAAPAGDQPAPATKPPYPGSVHLAVLNNPSRVLAADLDGDGDVDLAATEDPHGGGWMEPPSDVSVFLNLGAGRFRPAVEYPLGWHATDMTTGDLDGDGHLDLVVAHHEGRGVMALLGDGQGGFPLELPVCEPVRSWALTVADLDGDGHLDVVTGDDVSVGLVVLLGGPAGLFPTQARIPLGQRVLCLDHGDLDGDGHLDLVALSGDVGSSYGSQLWTLAGDGAGGFAAPVAVATIGAARSIELGDLDGDGVLDLATGGLSGAQWLAGDGQGGLATAQVLGPLVVDTVELVDLEGDGDLDVVGAGTGKVVRYLGDGQGGFRGPHAVFVATSGDEVTVADLDGDDRLDAAVTGWGLPGVIVLQGIDGGGFDAATPIRCVQPQVGTEFMGTALGDLDGDGFPDLVASFRGGYWQGGTVGVSPGHGDGSFGWTRIFETGDSDTGAVALGELNGDGVPDVAVTGPLGVTLLAGIGGGALGAPTLVVPSPAPSALALADLQGDGVTDLVLAEGGLPGSVVVALGKGAGGFHVTQQLPAGIGPCAVAVADLDGDGLDDLAVASASSQEACVLLGLGQGRFAPALRFPCGNTPSALAVGDVDGDVLPDLLLSGSSLVLLRGLGQGHLAAPEPIVDWPDGNPQLSLSLRLARLDGDEELDLVLGHAWGVATVLSGLGDGGFRFEQSLFAFSYAPWVALGDLDLDGDLDMVLAQSSGFYSAAHLNRSVGRSGTAR